MQIICLARRPWPVSRLTLCKFNAGDLVEAAWPSSRVAFLLKAIRVQHSHRCFPRFNKVREKMSELASIESVSNGSAAPDEHEHELEICLKPLILEESDLHSLAFQFSTVYKDLARQSDEQFLPTPVTNLPTGEETGQFLAIDVGGTNLRVAFIELLGEAADDHDPSTNGSEKSRETIKKAQRPRVRRTLEKAWPIGEHLKMDKAEDLFAWIGDCIAEVVSDRLSSDVHKLKAPEELAMGITFSFPMM
jgi:hexokinase